MPMAIPPASVIPRLPHSVIPALPGTFPPSYSSFPPPAGYIPAILSVIPAKAGIHTPNAATAVIPAPAERAGGGRIPPTPLLRKGGGGLRHHKSAGFLYASFQPSPIIIPDILSVIPAPCSSFPRKRESTPPTRIPPALPPSFRPSPPSFRRRPESRTPVGFGVAIGRGVDSRFRGNDGVGAGMTECGRE